MYVHFVCLFAPWTQDVFGRVTRLSKVVQSALGTFCVCSDCGQFQEQVHISSFDS